ncbi:MAG: response regulator transcription factor [Saprospirales bacterium]|nr:response regulator transcription factor [Saprospirales bacterium]
MKRRLLSVFFLLACLAAAVLLFAALVRPEAPDASRRAEKINLALRRTAHLLLQLSGDSTAQIPPVEPDGSGKAWWLRLEQPIDYAALPALLQTSLDRHGIAEAYDVALFDCAGGDLVLGYAKKDFTENNDPPCGSRAELGACYWIKITFAEPSGAAPGALARGAAFAALLAAGFWLWRRKGRAGAAPQAIAGGRRLGQSVFDAANQALYVAGIRHELTYREAKLLQLFWGHPNQLLEREHIHQLVWADEGIRVGRSVDMFVSRLRKLLQADPALRLAAVHGVGYRLEVD